MGKSLSESILYLYGTSSERTAIKSADLPDNQRARFKENGGSEYEWDHDAESWVQISIGAAPHVSPGSSGGDAAVRTLLDAVTGAGAGSTFEGTGYCTFQASSDASHTGTSTIDVEVSNDGSNWLVAGTLSVTGNSDSDGIALNASWAFARGNVTAHGDSTNGVSLLMGR